MLADLPVPDNTIGALAQLVRDSGADELADRLEQAHTDKVKLLALSLDERALMLSALEDPPRSWPNCAPTVDGYENPA